jgi:hypothetical protein
VDIQFWDPIGIPEHLASTTERRPHNPRATNSLPKFHVEPIRNFSTPSEGLQIRDALNTPLGCARTTRNPSGYDSPPKTSIDAVNAVEEYVGCTVTLLKRRTHIRRWIHVLGHVSRGTECRYLLHPARELGGCSPTNSASRGECWFTSDWAQESSRGADGTQEGQRASTDRLHRILGITNCITDWERSP